MNDSSIGCSPHTNFKQKEFEKYLKLHIRIVEQAITKRNKRWPYNYFDLTAGSGYYIPNEDGIGVPVSPDNLEENDNWIKGSPIITSELVKRSDLNLNATFFEKDEKSFRNLKKHCKNQDIQARLFQDNWEKELESILREDYRKYEKIPRFGLIYIDPNGMPTFDKLGEITELEASQFLDLMIHISATNEKRTRRVYNDRFYELKRYIDEELDKDNWIIKKFTDNKNFQWCFFIGSNGPLGKWKSEGFYSLDDSDGKAILDQVNYTQDEKKQLNKTLFSI